MPFSRRQPSACFDLVDCSDLVSLTFISLVDVDMIVAYLHAKNEVNRSSSSKVMVGWKEYETFGYCDLSLYPMTFTSELDLHMVVTYLYAKN